MSVLRKIDQVVRLSETTRSDAVEMLVESGLDELIEKLVLKKNELKRQ